MPARLTREQLIVQFQETHGERFDYSLLKYKNANTKVNITCRIHGEFLQRPSDHKSGFGCSQCSGKARSTTEKFIQKAKAIHGDSYNYDKVNYISANTLVTITCKSHGDFETRPTWHIYGTAIGCSLCNNSKGEIQVRMWLIENSIKFQQQKTFKDCVDKIQLRFDFYLPNHNILIEFDGAQHFSSVHYRGHIQDQETKEKYFAKVQKSDQIKNDYCKQNNIKLIRIPYTKLKQIPKILTNEILCHTSN